jgi:hypothetical protein
MIAFSSDVPGADKIDATQRDLRNIEPDAILLFGNYRNPGFENLEEAIQNVYPTFASEAIFDPEAGEVGELLWKAAR